MTVPAELVKSPPPSLVSGLSRRGFSLPPAVILSDMSSEWHLHVFPGLGKHFLSPRRHFPSLRVPDREALPTLLADPHSPGHRRPGLTCALSKYARRVSISFVPSVPQLPASLRRLYNHLSFLFLKQINLGNRGISRHNSIRRSRVCEPSSNG